MFHFNLHTVESVTSGHPDKICDQISDAILDECLRQDPMSRVAVESFGGHNKLIIGGEVTTTARVDYAEVAARVYREVGYTDPLEITVNIVEQSPDIAMGVDTGGAGDQGIMYGYATDETPEFLPLAQVLSRGLTDRLTEVRESGELSWLKPDGKAQVTIKALTPTLSRIQEVKEYAREGELIGDSFTLPPSLPQWGRDGVGEVMSVLVSCQHDENVSQEEIIKSVQEKIIFPVFAERGVSLDSAEILVNPSGRFVLGGFAADTGLTGRKIMVDTYGGLAPHGGGAFSGKDSTKVDRSGAYMTRLAAKTLVAKGLAHQALVSVAYAIGRAEPVMISAVDEEGNDLSEHLKDFDFRPQAIIERLGLRNPVFLQTARRGHFGRAGVKWEEV
jgi:S-adenosylmethionine synthetase